MNPEPEDDEEGDEYLSPVTVNRVFPNGGPLNVLRGRPALAALSRVKFFQLLEPTPEPDGLTSRIQLAPGPVFVDMAIGDTVGGRGFISDLIKRGVPVILDVHFNPFDPGASFAIDRNVPGLINEDDTHRVIRTWSRPGMYKWVRSVFEGAAVVTTPFPDAVHLWQCYNPRIVLLQDCNDLASGERFCRQFLYAMHRSTVHMAPADQKRGKLRAKLMWPIMRYLVYPILLKKTVMTELRKESWIA